MTLQQSIEHVTIVYICNTHFVMVHVIYWRLSGQCFHSSVFIVFVRMGELGRRAVEQFTAIQNINFNNYFGYTADYLLK